MLTDGGDDVPVLELCVLGADRLENVPCSLLVVSGRPLQHARSPAVVEPILTAGGTMQVDLRS